MIISLIITTSINTNNLLYQTVMYVYFKVSDLPFYGEFSSSLGILQSFKKIIKDRKNQQY